MTPHTPSAQAGQLTLRKATRATEEAERRFLAPLGDAAAKRFRDALRALISPPPTRR
jgi:hypothetical protein